MSKVSASVRLEAEDHERAAMVALVDRRSISEIIAECVHRALPGMEAELQRPRLTPKMVAEIKAGKPVAEVLASPYDYVINPQAGALNETPPKPRK
jgi:hypothetical protein